MGACQLGGLGLGFLIRDSSPEGLGICRDYEGLRGGGSINWEYTGFRNKLLCITKHRCDL